MLRLRLEAGGVPAYLDNENLVQMDWMFSDATGGVRVLIAEEDFERAQEILAEIPLESGSSERPLCPRCSSSETAPDERPRRWAFLSLLLLGFPLMISKTKWRCHHCRHGWNEKNRAKDSSSGGG